MSTYDVPGFDPKHNDELAMGCWAEHADKSLILVSSTEGNRVIYEVFDMGRTPPLSYRDAMPEVSFKKTYSFDPTNKKPLNEKWTWHDKTPFPWDRVIKGGIQDGPVVSAEVTLSAAENIIETRKRHQAEAAAAPSTAAQRVAESLRLEGQELDREKLAQRADKIMDRVEGIVGSIAKALSNMGKKGGRSARR